MRLTTTVLLFTVALLASGCGGDQRVPVSGKVTRNGKGPLPGGNIRFVSVADPNRIGAGQIRPDGTYSVGDAPVGPCKVVIDNTHLDPNTSKAAAMPGVPNPKMGMGKGMMGMPGGVAPGVGREPKDADKKMGSAPKGTDVPAEMNADKTDFSAMKYAKIEGSYTKPETTSLTFDVPAGGGTMDFDVK